MKIDLEEARKTAQGIAIYSDPHSMQSSTIIESLCDEVQTLRELVGVQKELIAVLDGAVPEKYKNQYYDTTENQLRTKIAELEKEIG